MNTKEEIEIKNVLNKGQLYVNFPVMVVMFGFMGVSLYAYKNHAISKSMMFIGLLISFTIGWLVWSYSIVRWRIWAFEQIEEKFHKKLKFEAVKAKLIWADGHFLEKTEIRNSKQRDQIVAINQRIKELDELEHP